MSEKLLAAGSVTLLAAGSLLGATSAQAATVADCGTHPGATVTLINETICEVVYDTVGDHTFTPPAGISAFEAVLIGGGAGAGKTTVTENPGNVDKTFGYGGYFDHYVYEDVTGPYDVYVGDGGTFFETVWLNSNPTYTGGDSGESTDLGDNTADGRDGTWGRSSDINETDTGFLLSDEWLVGENNPLFPVIPEATRFAPSGNIFLAGDCLESVYGSGGSVCGDTYEDGASGAVIIRYSLPLPALSATGVEASAIGVGAGALLAGGVALGAVAAVRRARSNS